MPTGAAVDRVAAKLNVECFEVPTGWKYFGKFTLNQLLKNDTKAEFNLQVI